MQSIIFKIARQIRNNTSNNKHVDLGAGSRPRNPFGLQKVIGIDIIESKNPDLVRVRFGDPLPFEDSTVSSASAFDFLEHLPRAPSSGPTSTFVLYMQEIYRILEPGGVFLAVTPSFPSRAAFSDPTHVNFITKDTVTYFTDGTFAKTLGYGFEGNFEKIVNKWVLPTNRIFSSAPLDSFEKKIKFVAGYVKYIAGCFFKFRIPYTHIVWVLRKPKD